MASRRRAREFALQAMFEADLGRDSMQQALDALWESLLDDEDSVFGGRAAEGEEIDFASSLALGVQSDKVELDARIESSSINWRIARMAVVDRNLLRLGTYELLNHPEIPASVTINEAIELAKRYGTAESRAFVNGILDRIARNAGRL